MIRTFFLLAVACTLSVSSFADKGSKQAKPSSFTENKQWEQRLNDRLRSGTDLQMVKPVSGTNYTAKTIEFEWGTPANHKMFLGLLNNENKEVYYQEVKGTKAVISVQELGLKPGLYYWILESEEEVLTLGKFFYQKK